MSLAHHPLVSPPLPSTGQQATAGGLRWKQVSPASISSGPRCVEWPVVSGLDLSPCVIVVIDLWQPIAAQSYGSLGVSFSRQGARPGQAGLEAVASVEEGQVAPSQG